MQKKIKSFDSTIINYDISLGKNKNNFLIFLHGLGGDLKMWKEMRKFFHKLGISTLAIDFRGHGKSGKPGLLKDYNIENFAKDINEVIKKEKILNPIIIGHSLGGMVAFTFYRLYPKTSKSYVIIGSSYKVPCGLKSVFKNILFYSNSFNGKNKKTASNKWGSPIPIYRFIKNLTRFDLIEMIKGAMHSSVPSILLIFESMKKINEKKILSKIVKPFLIISGGEDSIVPLRNSEVLHRLIKNSQIKIFPLESHEIIMSIPKEVSEEIYSFIKKK